MLSLRSPEFPPTAEEKSEALAEHVLCAMCRTRRFVFVASFDPPNSSILQTRRKEVAKSGFKSPVVWLESMCPNTAGGFVLSGPLSLSSVGKRQMQEHLGLDVLRGFSDPDLELIVVRRGGGWEPSARHGCRAGIRRGRILPLPVPILACATNLDAAPSVPWASRRSTWHPQTSQWSRKPCSCSSKLGNERHNPAPEDVAAPSDGSQLSGLRIQEQASQPERSTHHPLSGHELQVLVPGIGCWRHLGYDGICYKYRSLFSTFRDF